ncbi:MAG: hypothetical protein WCI71_10845 [Bacteroidota bacterium]
MTKQEITTANAADALDIVKGIIDVKPPEEMQQDLREMMDTFFLYHDNIHDDHKRRIYGTFTTLNEALSSITMLEIAIKGTGLEHLPVM